MGMIAVSAHNPGAISIEHSPATRMAAQELRRYAYLRTGALAELTPVGQTETGSGATRFYVGLWPSETLRARLSDSQIAELERLGPESRFILSDRYGGVALGGRSPSAALSAAYRYAELLGVRFAPDRDIIPDGHVPLVTQNLNIIESPSMSVRGFFPYHSGNPQGPEFWTEDEHKLFLGQLKKMGLNTIAMLLHHREDGTIDATWVPSWEEPYHVGRAPFGMAQVFPEPIYRSKVASSILGQRIDRSAADKRRVSDQNTAMIQRAFQWGRHLGIDAVMGGFINEGVDYWKRAFTFLEQEGFEPKFIWQHTYEDWIWTDPAEEIIMRAINGSHDFIKARDELGLDIRPVISGWTVGPRLDPLRLHRDIDLQVIMAPQVLDVGRANVDAAYGAMGERPRWVVPWLEDDFNMIAPQLWVERTLFQVRDGKRLGSTGFLATLWRVRGVEPQAMALAQAGWRPSLTSAEFWLDYSTAAFGPEVAPDIAAILREVDGLLPRPTNWKDGWPGGIHFDQRPWETVSSEYRFVERLEALAGRVQGEASRARFAEMLEKMRYLRALGELRTVIGTEREGEVARTAYTHLLQSASTVGDLGDLIFLNRQIRPGKSQEYSGTPRLLALTPRPAIQVGEDFTVRLVLIDRLPPRDAKLLWRPLGHQEWRTVEGSTEGLHGFRVTLPSPQEDFEWVLEVTGHDGQKHRLPASAPNQPGTTVVFGS